MSFEKHKSFSERLIRWFNEKYATSQVFRRFIIYNIFILLGFVSSWLTSFVLSVIFKVNPLVIQALSFFLILEIAFFFIVKGVEET